MSEENKIISEHKVVSVKKSALIVLLLIVVLSLGVLGLLAVSNLNTEGEEEMISTEVAEIKQERELISKFVSGAGKKELLAVGYPYLEQFPNNENINYVIGATLIDNLHLVMDDEKYGADLQEAKRLLTTAYNTVTQQPEYIDNKLDEETYTNNILSIIEYLAKAYLLSHEYEEGIMFFEQERNYQWHTNPYTEYFTSSADLQLRYHIALLYLHAGWTHQADDMLNQLLLELDIGYRDWLSQQDYLLEDEDLLDMEDRLFDSLPPNYTLHIKVGYQHARRLFVNYESDLESELIDRIDYLRDFIKHGSEVNARANELILSARLDIYESRYKDAVEKLDAMTSELGYSSADLERYCPECFMLKGEALLELYINEGDRQYLENSLRNLEKANEIRPRNSRVLLALGTAQRLSGDEDKAINTFIRGMSFAESDGHIIYDERVKLQDKFSLATEESDLAVTFYSKLTDN